MKELNRFKATQRTEGISTTDLIVRILKDRDMYFERSLKKGMKPEDLNLSLKEADYYYWVIFAGKVSGNFNVSVIEILKKLKSEKEKK